MDKRYLDNFDPNVGVLDGDAMEVVDGESELSWDRLDDGCEVHGPEQTAIEPM